MRIPEQPTSATNEVRLSAGRWPARPGQAPGPRPANACDVATCVRIRARLGGNFKTVLYI